MKKFILWLTTLCMCVCIFDSICYFTTQAAQKEYKIMVNRAANCVTVYEKDAFGAYSIPVKAFVCSCGREGHETPLGTYRTSNYYEWRLMVDGTYGHYAVRFNRGIMFHSVPYYTPNAGDLEWEQYNLLGEAASLGCVRLACADVKWIYDNCKQGTEVTVYDDAQNPGPLGKPEEVKLATEHPYKTWDPTDTDVNNPWNEIRPVLHLMNERGDGIVYLPFGATQEDIYNALAIRTRDGVVYPRGEYEISMTGDYDLNTAGKYVAHVCGTNAAGMRAEQDMLICVE